MTCRVCGNAVGNTRHRAREMLIGLRDEFDYVECASCQCLQIAEVPADLERYYPREYYAFESLEWPPRSRLAAQLRRARLRFGLERRGVLGAVLERLTGPADLPPYLRPARLRVDDRILDVGCGNGYLLYELGERGFTSLTGVDPFIAGDVRTPTGIRMFRRHLGEVTGEFDCIILNHAFEHMPDPGETFRLLADRLSAHGVIVIRIPVVPCFAWDAYGVDWLQLDAPRHLFLHSPASIRLLADACDLQVTQLVYDSDARQFWGSEQYRRDIPHLSPHSYKVDPSASMFTAAEICDFEARARVLNLECRGDQASFYIRRKEAAARS